MPSPSPGCRAAATACNSTRATTCCATSWTVGSSRPACCTTTSTPSTPSGPERSGPDPCPTSGWSSTLLRVRPGLSPGGHRSQGRPTNPGGSAMQTSDVEYQVDGQRMVGYLAVPDEAGPRAAVLISHEGPGLDDHAK